MHNEKPERGDLTAEEISRVERMLESEYAANLQALLPPIRGETVINTIAGNAGFALQLSGEKWVVAYLRSGILDCVIVEAASSVSTLISQPTAGDPIEPVFADLPYATERCNVGEEVQKCVGQPLEGFAIGEGTFNFCFPEGMELDAAIVHDRGGRLTVRVFWEQW